MYYSVIIPVYNKGQHVARAVQSVLNQTHKDWELILVDDASTDDSLNVIKGFKDDRITIIERETPGPGGYKARNAGVDIASFDWVSFLDADDEWGTEYLAVIDKLHSSFPEASFLSTGWKNQYLGGDLRSDIYFQKYKDKGSHIYNKINFLECSLESFRPVCTIVATIRKDIFLKTGMFPRQGVGRGGDVDTWFRIIMSGAIGAWAAYEGAVYYRDSENMTTQNVAPRFRGNHLLSSIKLALKNETECGVRKLLKKYRKSIYLSIVKGKSEVFFIKFTQTVLGDTLSRRLIEGMMRIKKKIRF